MTITAKPIINHRQKTLIGLLSTFGGRLPNIDFQKYLFLYTHEFQEQPSFDFVPYKFGSFSFQSYADKRRLVEIEVLSETEDWRLDKRSLGTGDLLDQDKFGRFHQKYAHLKGDQLVQELYRRYPYYAINSEIAGRLMNTKEIAAIKAARPDDDSMCLFTIGYEGSSFDGYLNRLIRHNIRTLVDVRRNALSRKYGFSKRTLSDTLMKLGIEYVHIPELGIASEKRRDLVTQADYDRLFDSYELHELKRNPGALRQLFDLFLDRKRLALTCFEAHACMCHRGRVVKALSKLPEWQYSTSHI